MAQKRIEAATRFVMYPGPHQQVTLKNVGEFGTDITFDRGVPIELAAEIADDLIRRKKVRAASGQADRAAAEESKTE